jgi:manganese/zinc/iron transport system permease protein
MSGTAWVRPIAAQHTALDMAQGAPFNLSEFVDVLALRGGFNTNVVLSGTALLGLAAGVVGTFALLRQRSLVADALSHAALPGVALAFLAASSLGLTGHRLPWLLLGALLTGLAAAAAIELLVSRARLSGDTATAVVLASSFGLGTVLLGVAQRTAGGGQAGLAHLVFGRTAGLLVRDVQVMAALATVALVTALLLGRGFAAVAFNERFARTTGLPVRGLDAALGALLALVTLAGLQAVGMLLVVALLVAPAAAARLWVTRVPAMAALAGALGAASGYVGAALSATVPNAPAGAVIVLTAATIFGASLVLSPHRGVVAVARRRRALARAASSAARLAAREEVAP